MSLTFNKRLISALAISLTLHAILLLLTGNAPPTNNEGMRGKLRVTLAEPSQRIPSAEIVTPLMPKDAPVKDASSLIDSAPDHALALAADNHYFLNDEVDKRSYFVFTEPLDKLEKIIASDTEVKLTVKVLINEEGLVDSVTVLKSVPSSIYNEESVKALLQSRFSPAEKGGRKVKSQKLLEIKFAAKGVVS